MLVKHLGENEQAKGESHDVEIDLENHLGGLLLVVGPLKKHLQMCKQESQNILRR